MVMQALSKIFGSRNDRQLKRMNKVVQQINALEEQIEQLSAVELADQQKVFRERMQAGESLDDILPESALELYLDETSAAIAGYRGLLVKTQVDTGRGYSYRLLLVGFDGAIHKQIALGTQTDCDCSASAALNKLVALSSWPVATSGPAHMAKPAAVWYFSPSSRSRVLTCMAL